MHLSDLNWTDKERVLRLLFAKINSVQGTVRRMPDHSLTTMQFTQQQDQSSLAQRQSR